MNPTVTTPDGHTINLDIQPAHTTPIGTVVLTHGITSNRNEHLGLFAQAASRFAADGITTIRFDFRGHGNSHLSPRDTTITGQLLDLITVTDYANIYLPTPLALIGSSFGAITTIHHARRPTSQRITAVGLWNPVLDIRATFVDPGTDWSTTAFNFDTTARLDRDGYTTLDNFPIGRDFVSEITSPETTHTVLTDLDELNIPILAIHGTDDTLVPYHHTLEAAIRNPSIDLRTLHGASHGFSNHQPTVIHQTSQWLTHHLSQPR